MTIIMTGSRGAIGRKLKLALTDNGEDVVGFDHGYDCSDSEYGDICDPSLLNQRIGNNRIEGIIHLAALSRVQFGQDCKTKCFSINVDGAKNVFRCAYESASKPWIIFASTREVYGQQTLFPVNENAKLSPCNIYGQSKLQAEKIAHEYQQQGLNISILRLSAVYGSMKYYHESKVVTSFCRNALLNKDIEINGAKSVFDFIHIEDVLEAILLTIKSCRQKKILPPLNICSGVGITLEELAQVVLKHTKSKNLIVKKSADNTFMPRFIGSPQLAFELLNWCPKVSLENGVKKFIGYLNG